MGFTLCAGTKIGKIPETECREAVENAAGMLARDLKKRFGETGGAVNEIGLVREDMGAPELFEVRVLNGSMTVAAGDALGFVYGLLYISEKFLGVAPFWFWADQKIGRIDPVTAEDGVYRGDVPAVRFRGWFINDEVLLSHWSIDGDPVEPWRMALEALLRCGGNMVIPGTDKNARRYRSLASSHCLWKSCGYSS